MITAITNIYKGDRTMARFGSLERKMYRIYYFVQIDNLFNNGGAVNERNRIQWWTNTKSLFYADDGLLLAHSVEEAARNLKITIKASKKCGVNII